MDGLPGEIKCLFFSQFHPIAGPKISCQVWYYTLTLYVFFSTGLEIDNMVPKVSFNSTCTCSVKDRIFILSAVLKDN